MKARIFHMLFLAVLPTLIAISLFAAFLPALRNEKIDKEAAARAGDSGA